MRTSVLSAQLVSEDSAVWQLRDMQARDLDAVMVIELAAYPFPWTRGNFSDSLNSHYDCKVLHDALGKMAGYFLLMTAVDECHILNITVRPDLQGLGVGRLLFKEIKALAFSNGCSSLLLEVRPSNSQALGVYKKMGFDQIGLRKNYYPAGEHAREDALVMRLVL
jgi:ribosomal-protein-alanine N-acetyltransferase